MQVRQMMTTNVASCKPDTPLEEVAQMMMDCDCGMIPIVAGDGTTRAVGTVTDRDIVCRTLASGDNPLDFTASDVMTNNPITISLNATHDEAMTMMEHHQIRRLLVIDHNGECIGIVSQADLARHASEEEIGEVVQHISQPGGGISPPV